MNQPLADALVRLVNTFYWTYTDSAGGFTIRVIHPGPTLVIIECSGYIPVAYPINASPSEVTILDIRMQKYIPPPPPPGGSRWSLRMRGGVCYFLMEDYNRAYGSYRYFAPTRSYEEIEGSPLHLGSGLELEGIVSLSETWKFGIGVGFLHGADTYQANANFIGPFLHSYNRRFRAIALPVSATLYYNRRYSVHRLYFGMGAGYYPVLVRLEDEDVFQENGPIRSTGDVYGAGLGIHQVCGVEYFLTRRLALAAELRARLAAVSGLTGVRKVVSSRGRFEENVGLYLQDYPRDNYEVMVLLPETGQTGGSPKTKKASVTFTGVQAVIALNIYL